MNHFLLKPAILKIWRYYLIDRLTLLQGQYDWASILLKDLQGFKYSQSLNFYLSDIRWFDYQQGIYEINNKKEMKNYEIQESLYSRSYCNSFDIKQSMASSKNSQRIKDLLNETNIMNDEFYHIIGENRENPSCGLLQPNHQTNPIKINRNSSQSIFKNNTLVQPNLLENFQRSEEIHANNEANCDIKSEMLAVQMKKCLFHYKGITEKIESHLADEKNIFGDLKRKFVSDFCKKHHYFFRNEDLKTASKQIFKELKIFINILQEILTIFYKLNDYKSVLNYFLFTKENLCNFVTSLLFESPQLSELILSINQELHKEEENILQTQYENAKDFLPIDFEVSNKYCLNEKTLQYIYEKKNVLCGNNNILNNNNNDKSNYTSTALPDKMDKSLRTNSISKVLSDAKQFKSRIFEFEDETQKIKIKIKDKPFQKAIRKLRKIAKVASPLHKLKTILQTSEHLFQEIRDFYGEFDFQLNEGLGGDELLGLFVYIVAQAKIPDLLSHCAIIKMFLTSNLTNSISGYYLVTIQVALDYLLSMKIDKKSRTFSSMKEFHQFIKIGGYEKTI